jgi:hypothetical protein
MASVPDGVPFIWDQAERRVEAQIRQADALDTKASVIIGLHALAGGVVGSVATRLSGAAAWIGFASLIGLTITGALAFVAFRTQDYDLGPAPTDLWRFGDWGETEIKYRFLGDRFNAIETNRQKLNRKARRLSRSIVGFGMLSVFVALSAAVAVVRAA